MSIHKMIASHPDVAGNLNEALATAVSPRNVLRNDVRLMC